VGEVSDVWSPENGTDRKAYFGDSGQSARLVRLRATKIANRAR
jgi:hypothetical protein